MYVTRVVREINANLHENIDYMDFNLIVNMENGGVLLLANYVACIRDSTVTIHN